MKIYRDLFNQIISMENLFSAWEAFCADKRNKIDVQGFERNLEKNIFQLRRELADKTYRHGPYKSFFVHDPKQRHIHKAMVRDRILHHAIFTILNPIFEETFIPTSFSCRIGYGTHKGVLALAGALRKVSCNNTRPCFALKCDVKKFFDSVDHAVLLSVMEKRIEDDAAMQLLWAIVGSYRTTGNPERERVQCRAAKGIPIGNLTSQLFANIYMNEFDQFIKHILKIKHYVRYTDDFIIVGESRENLENILPKIKNFLHDRIFLTLHPEKVSIRRFHQGVDFLGYVAFPHHRLLRTKTKRRIFIKLEQQAWRYCDGEISKTVFEQSLQSYLGVLSHANSYRISEALRNQFWF